MLKHLNIKNNNVESPHSRTINRMKQCGIMNYHNLGKNNLTLWYYYLQGYITIDKFQLFWTLVTFGSGIKCYMYYKVEEIF